MEAWMATDPSLLRRTLLYRTQPDHAARSGRARPWVMRTYAGHSSAAASNALFRKNLAKGQTGLSIAFDLPTQTGYDPDDELARGEVGKVGVPVTHLGDMRALVDGIPLDEMNTSMTINATAMWLLSLYIAAAEEQGVDPAALQGTTQNDIIKEYLSRGTYVFPPGPSLRLITDMVAYTVANVPQWNPTNICSYHLQEAGATPVQELAFSLSTAIAVLDAVRDSGQVPPGAFRRCGAAHLVLRQRGRPLRRGDVQDAGVRAALGRDHERAVRRHRSQAAPVSLRGPGQLPRADRGPAGEQRRAHHARDACASRCRRTPRASAIQLPAWNEALGLPRPWDQQWSLRMQQVLAFESDLLEYGRPVRRAHRSWRRRSTSS